jgi:hypothetical protein
MSELKSSQTGRDDADGGKRQDLAAALWLAISAALLFLLGFAPSAHAQGRQTAEDQKLMRELRALRQRVVVYNGPELKGKFDPNQDYNVELGYGWRFPPQDARYEHPIVARGGKLNYKAPLNTPQQISESAKSITQRRVVKDAAEQTRPYKGDPENSPGYSGDPYLGCHITSQSVVYKNGRLAIVMLEQCVEKQIKIRLLDAVLIPEGMGLVYASIPRNRTRESIQQKNIISFGDENGITWAFIPLKYFDVNYCPYKGHVRLDHEKVEALVYRLTLSSRRILRYVHKDYEIQNPNTSCGELR